MMLMMAAACSAGASVPPLVLAVRGEAAKCQIVVETNASPCIQFAAEELSTFIERQTGVKLPVVAAADRLTPHSVVLGDTRHTPSRPAPLKPDAFRIHALPPNLFITGGGDRGVLYGVYELLERFGDCAWYSPRFEVVPRLKSFSVPGAWDETQSPAFALRSMIANGWSANPVHAARNKLNLEGFDERLGGSEFRFDSVLGKCHTFENLLSAKEWFKVHPEYFSERDGKRIGYRTQLCLGNPEVLRICTEKTLERIAQSYPKGIRRFGISPNDWGNWCECPQCAALDRRERSHAGSLIAFVNRIAEAVEARYPDVIIETLAYSYTRRPPATLKARRNVQICLCTIECDFARPISLGRSIENRATRHALLEWAKHPAKLSVWDYAGDFACYQHVWPNFRSLRENLRFFRANGVDELFELGVGGGEQDIWAHLRAWFIAKWMWNPELDEATLLSKCLADCFGPAADEVRAYYEIIHSDLRDTKRHPMGCFESAYAPGISDQMLEAASAAMARARTRAQGTRFADNVRQASLPVDFMCAIRGYARPSMAVTAVDHARYEVQREGARRVLSAMDSPASLRFADDPVWGKIFGQWIREFANAKAMRPPARRLGFEEWAFTGTTPVAFRVVEDPLAGDGRALMLPGELAKCSCWFELDSVITDPDGIYMPRIRLRVGESGPRSTAFFAGIYNMNWRKTVFGAECPLSDVPRSGDAKAGRYFWYNVGALRPRRGDVVWIALGQDTGDRHPDVWIDRLELFRLSGN